MYMLADLVVERAHDQPPTHHEGQEQDKSANDVLAQTRKGYTKDPIDSLQRDYKGGGDINE